MTDIPVLIFQGKKDWVVYPRVAKEVKNQLERYVKPELITSVFNTPTAHVWSIDNGNCKCGKCGLYTATVKCCDVNNCGYDLSGDFLRRTYGATLKPRTTAFEFYYWID